MKRKIISYASKGVGEGEQRAHFFPTDGPAVMWIKQMMSHSGGCYCEQAVIHHRGPLRMLWIEWDLSSCYTSDLMPLRCSKKIKVRRFVGMVEGKRINSVATALLVLRSYILDSFFCFVFVEFREVPSSTRWEGRSLDGETCASREGEVQGKNLEFSPQDVAEVFKILLKHLHNLVLSQPEGLVDLLVWIICEAKHKIASRPRYDKFSWAIKCPRRYGDKL